MGKWVKYKNKYTGKEETMYLPFANEDKADPNAPQVPLTNPEDTSNQLKVSNVVENQAPPQYFNRNQAIQDGFSEEEINNYLTEKRKQGINLIDDPKQVQNFLSQQQAQQPIAETKKERSLLAKILPILGGVGGAVAGIPLGLPGIIGGGFLGQGAGETVAQTISGEKIDPQKIATEATIGGVSGLAGPVLGSAGKFLFGGGRVAAQVAGQTAEEIAAQTASKGLVPKVTEAIARKSLAGAGGFKTGLVEEAMAQGVNLPEEFGRAIVRAKVPNGANPVHYLVDRTENGITTKGIINREWLPAERKIIRAELAKSGDEIVIPIKEYTSPLYQKRIELSRTVGNESKIAKLDELISATEAKYPKGLTATQAYDAKLAADSTFGKGVMNDDVGAIPGQVQKVLGNKARDVLHTKFPTISEALNNEQKYLYLRTGLNTTAAKATAKGFTGYFNPATMAARAVNNPRVSNVITKGSPLSETAPTLTNVVNGVPQTATTVAEPSVLSKSLTALKTPRNYVAPSIGQGVTRSLNGGGDTAPVPPTDMSMGMASTQPQQERSVVIQGNTITESQLKQAIIEASATGQTKTVTALENIQKQAFPETKDAKLTEADKKVAQATDIAEMALTALDSGNIDTGKGAAIKSFFEELTGTQSPEVTDFKSLMAIAKSNFRVAMIGAGQTESEAKNLADAMFDLSQPKQVLRQRIKTFIETNKNYTNRYAGGAGTIQGNGTIAQ